MTDATATATGDPGAAAPAASGAPGATSQPAAPWYAGTGYTDDDRVFMENKGWTKLETAVPAPVLKSYRELERVMGAKANAVILPQSGDAKGLTELMTRLGRPAESKGYTLPASFTPDRAQNLDAKLVERYQGWAHKANLTNDQYGVLLAEHEAAIEAAENEAIDRFNGDVARTNEKLKAEMGAGFGEAVARGNLAMRHFGITEDQRNKISEAMGVEGATRMLMSIGSFLAQHKAVGLDNGGKPADGFVTDKARATARIQAIKMLPQNATGPDADFKRAMLDSGHPEHRNVTAQWREWNRVANS
jgi:hypothetical protein